MKRRSFLTLSTSSVGALLLSGHAPYRQWSIYRQTHLVILTSRDDSGADDLGDKFAELMRRALPDSKASVARGPRVQRICSLISTRQAEVGVLSRANARAIFRGEAPFEEYGPVALRVLVQNPAYQLVCRDDFLPQHGYLVAEALLGNGQGLDLAIPGRDAGARGEIPPHIGALAFAEGRPLEAPKRQ